MSVVEQRRGLDFIARASSPEEVLVPEDMDSEQRMMMNAIREFAAKEVEPVMEKVLARDEATHRDLFRKAAELGIFMAEVPEEYGGLGLSVLSIAGMNESRSFLGDFASTAFAHQGIGTLPLVNFGTPEQIEKFLPRCMSGEIMCSFALTEPSSGSDAMNIRTKAVLSADGSHYVVNGSKQWITNAGWADLFMLFAKVDGREFTCFLMERNSPGLTVHPNEKLLGIKGSSVCALTLENVKIPAGNVLGEIGKGHKVALCTLNLGRLKMASHCAGASKKALQIATAYAAERRQFGVPIGEFGLIQRKLAEMAARTYAAESIAYRTAGMVYTALQAMGDEARHSVEAKLKVLSEFSAECALAKVYNSETYNFCADETLQIHGGYGFSEEYPAAKIYRDSRITRIYEGTAEICRITAAKALLRRTTDAGAAWPVATSGPAQSPDTGGPLAALKGHVDELKNVLLYVLDIVLREFGPEALLDKDKQQYLSCFSDMGVEIYAAESAILRVLKLQARHGEKALALPEAMARLVFERSVERVRQEATEALAGFSDAGALRDHLAKIETWLPLPCARITLRSEIADALLASGGKFPEYR